MQNNTSNSLTNVELKSASTNPLQPRFSTLATFRYMDFNSQTPLGCSELTSIQDWETLLHGVRESKLSYFSSLPDDSTAFAWTQSTGAPGKKHGNFTGKSVEWLGSPSSRTLEPERRMSRFHLEKWNGQTTSVRALETPSPLPALHTQSR